MPAVISPTQTGAFLYVVGGQTNTNLGANGFTSTIFIHPLNANGAFTGSWLTATLPITLVSGGELGLVYGQALVHKGYLYVLGGYDGFTDHSEIFRAPINSSSGQIGAWIENVSIPQGSGLDSFGAAIWPNGSGPDYLYILGGKNPSTLADVSVSTFNGDGSLNAFTAGSFPVPLGGSYGLGAVQGNGQLYLTGGSLGSTSTVSNVVESVLINPDGTFPDPGWISTNPLPQPRYYHGAVINSGGEVYVIGGYSGSAAATNTVYHGSTTGAGPGGQYAPAGTFTSRAINLGAQRPLTSLAATTTLTNSGSTVVTLTLQYRLANSESALSSAPWISLPKSPNGLNTTTTYPLSGTLASFVQYRGFFTTTLSTLSPMLNEIDINYPAPPNPSDLVVSYMQAPPTSTVATSKAITIQISNIGQGPASPIRRDPATLPSAPLCSIATRQKPITREFARYNNALFLG